MYRFFRRNLNLILVAISLILLVRYAADIAPKFAVGEWSLENFYAALFDWSSILSAFMFGIYAFVLSRSEPFMKAASGTRAFEDARDYVRRTVYLALAMTAVCVPMLVAGPSPVDGGWLDYGYWIFASYVVGTVYLFSRFLKIVRVFRKLEQPRAV